MQTRPSACSQDGLDECQVWLNQAPAGNNQDRASGHLPSQHQGSCRNLVQHPLCRWPRYCNPDAWFILDAQGHHSHPILQLHRSLDIEVGSRECHDRREEGVNALVAESKKRHWRSQKGSKAHRPEEMTT